MWISKDELLENLLYGIADLELKYKTLNEVDTEQLLYLFDQAKVSDKYKSIYEQMSREYQNNVAEQDKEMKATRNKG